MSVPREMPQVASHCYSNTRLLPITARAGTSPSTKEQQFDLEVEGFLSAIRKQIKDNYCRRREKSANAVAVATLVPLGGGAM